MKQAYLKCIVLVSLLLCVNSLSAKENIKVLTIKELFELIESNSVQLKALKQGITTAQVKEQIAKDALLPNLSTSLTMTYIGDATILESDFSQTTRVKMPHFGNAFSVQASQLVYKGGAVRNSIEKASLENQVAQLSYCKTKADLKFQLLGYYLDFYKLKKQQEIFQKNIETSKLRMQNIQKMYKEGMVTNNDLLRGELQISNLTLRLQEVESGLEILNNQITTLIGLSADIQLLPDTTLLSRMPEEQPVTYFKEQMLINNPELQIAGTQSQIAGKGVMIAKADYLPTVALIAGNDLSRPITKTTPVLDMYSNGWYAGVNVSYNISSLYKNKHNVRMAKSLSLQAGQALDIQRQRMDIETNAAYTKYQEAKNKIGLLEKDLQNSAENFRIMEKRYLNGLAIYTDMQDADNARIQSEIQMTVARINLIFSYAKLQYVAGEL